MTHKRESLSLWFWGGNC